MGGSDEEDEDTHFCIKCHATMRGLDNYVAHRKAKCRPEKEVEAVDFFSSLNLQSSSSKTPTGSGFWPPPPAYTGGKWKPGTIEDTDQQHNELGEVPPPGHTGGKWKPPQAEQSETPRPGEVPPPEHTRGKWGPAERPWGQMRKGLYWCGPCNRRLSSRVVYERHVRSELHFKRTNQWPGSEPQVGSRTRIRTKAILSTSLKVINRRYTNDKELVRKKKKKGGPLVCEACGCKVWPHMIGKHLVSHYHVRHRRPGWEHLVLGHMDSVVRHFPFQCGLCKFYTNTVREFMDHWTSGMHTDNDRKLDGSYWCTICKWSCDSTISMGYHLNSKSHEQFVSVINRSVPVVIQKHVSICCEVCSRRFRYNFQLRTHARAWGHTQIKSSASDGYQEVIACKDCHYRCFSLVSYQRHIRMKHGKEMHFCRRCDIRFATLVEARKHRQEAKHREKGNTEIKRCIHCQATFTGLSAIREHLTREHPEERHRCAKCGAEFVLKQELSRHARTEGECGRRREGGSSSGGSRSCGECGFSTDSEAELLLHGILHVGPDPSTGRYHCPTCGGWFVREALKNHARTHTRERAFVCSLCGASFSRRDSLAKHMSRIHGTRGSSRMRSQMGSCRQLSIRLEQERTKDFQCLQCPAAFYDKGCLERHGQRHEGKKFPCGSEGCIFKGRSAAELRIHQRTHSSAREFHCTDCQYSAKTRGQLSKHVKNLHMEGRRLDCPHCDFTTKNNTHLRRHINLHTGQKPYLCPHCPFSCTLLDNLRKHVINSKLHPGKFLYECCDCDMKTNFSKEMKAHLVSSHGASPSVAAKHVAALYRQEEEPPGGLVPVKPNRRKKKSEEDMEEDQLPTLASVALNPHEEDVIFIEVDEDLEGVLYHQSVDPAFALESYTPDRV